MRLSNYYLPTLKQVSAEITTPSHILSIRGGFVKQTGAGMYTWLPIGLKVLDKIQKVIQEEMDKIGALQIIMPCIQQAELWKESGRYDVYGKEMLRIKDRNGRDMLFSPTNEELMVAVVRNTINSYKSLPFIFYQIQWKFRDEIRPRFGLMRAREFLMKDAYSFDVNIDNAKRTYERIYQAYCSIFKRLNLNFVVVTADGGEVGGDLSNEFHILSDAGESEIIYDERLEDDFNNRSLYASTKERHIAESCDIPFEKLKSRYGIEVGHLFHFGDKYTLPMKSFFKDKSGSSLPMKMGSYGIGISRLFASIIEAYHDEKGIVWPEAVAPFKIAILNLGKNEAICDNLYLKLSQNNSGQDVLYDDTSDSIGVKLNRIELIGIPWIILVGKKYIEQNVLEVYRRGSSERLMLSLDEVETKLSTAM